MDKWMDNVGIIFGDSVEIWYKMGKVFQYKAF